MYPWLIFQLPVAVDRFISELHKAVSSLARMRGDDKVNNGKRPLHLDTRHPREFSQ